MLRRAFCAGVAAALLLGASAAIGDELPVNLQAELVTRLASYDRNMKARAGQTVSILVLVKDGDADSARSASQLTAALNRSPVISGLPITVQTVTWVDAATTVASAKIARAGLVFVTAALAGEMEGLARALDKVDVLTIAPSAEMTRRGSVLGFELVSSRPKLFINLTQADRQNVSMPAEVLKLMTVYR
ncbi:MAG: hypothetical protein JWP97_4910 [Labilithrix sp.]|nr:hypothetical protein [Labilithrix sp.]